MDFIELRCRQGMPLAEAAIDAGAARLRPVLLTAAVASTVVPVVMRIPLLSR